MTERPSWSPVVLGAMLGCVALAVARLIETAVRAFGVSFGWYTVYLVAACGLAALEAYYRRWRRRWDRSVEGPDKWKLAAFEILVFFVLLKMGSYAGDSLSQVWADVQSWVREPARILDGETLVASVLAALSWLAFTQTLVDLERLSESPEFWSGAQSGAQGMLVPQARLAARFLWGGVILLVATGLTWIGQSWAGISALLSRAPSTASVPVGHVLPVVVYFVLGLIMASRVHFVELRQDWTVQKTAVGSQLEAKWWRYSFVFIGLAAVAALLLPTGYTRALLDVLRFALAVVLRVLYLVGAGLLILVSLPFWLVARWLFGEEIAGPRAPTMEAIRPPALPSSGEGPAWLGIVRVVVFWILLFGFAIYLVRGLLREHPEVWQALKSVRPIRWLLRLWKVWWARFALWRAAVRARVRIKGAQASEAERASGSAISRARAPQGNRGRVLYYYGELLRLAERAGFPRDRAQTPLAYSATLKDKLPENRAHVDALTGAFVEARYSRHLIGTEIVRQVRASWQQIKQNLGRVT